MIGKRIKDLLERNDMKQKELAEKVGIHEVSMSRYINGDHTPNPEILVKIANVLGVSVDYLLGKSDYKLPPQLNGAYRVGEGTVTKLSESIYRIDLENLIPTDSMEWVLKLKDLTKEQRQILASLVSNFLNEK